MIKDKDFIQFSNGNFYNVYIVIQLKINNGTYRFILKFKYLSNVRITKEVFLNLL